MFEEKLTFMTLLAGTIAFVGFLVVCAFGIFGRPMSIRNPYAIWTVCLIMTLVIYDSWKNKKELLKRILIAAPFSFVLFWLMLFALPELPVHVYALFTLLFIMALMEKTNHLKLHYIITLIIAMICFFAFRMGTLPEREDWHMHLAFGCGLPAFGFYSFYYKRLSENEEIEIRPLALRSVLFSVSVMILISIFIGLVLLCANYKLGQILPFVISIILSLCFWGFWKWLVKKDLFLSSHYEKNKQAGVGRAHAEK